MKLLQKIKNKNVGNAYIFLLVLKLSYFDGQRLSKITSTVENYTESLEFSDYGNVELILPETIINMN